MKFTVIAALVASASAAGTIATGAACTKTEECKETTDCCADVAKSADSVTVTSGYTKVDKASKICWAKTATTFQTAGTDSAAVAWLTATPTSGTKYEGTFKCLAAGAKTLSAAAVLAASYYMA